jgi:hypothetical protein
MNMEQTECSEISAYKIQMPGNYPEESIQHSERTWQKFEILNSVLAAADMVLQWPHAKHKKGFHSTNCLSKGPKK